MPDTSETESSRTPVYRWKRWLPLGATLIVLCLLYGLDQHLKQSSTQGFSLKQAEWSIGADNVGMAWRSLYNTDAWAILSKEGDPLREDIIELRKQLEIRLSPRYWNTWMGSAATLSGVGDDWMLVTRPGVLMRIFDGVNRSSDSIGLSRYGPYYYRWHEGYLCVSKSRDLLASVQATTVQSMPLVGDDQAVVLQSPEALCTLRMVDSLPVFGSLSEDQDESAIRFSESKPFSLLPLLRDYTPAWEASGSTRTFQGDLREQAEAFLADSSTNE